MQRTVISGRRQGIGTAILLVIALTMAACGGSSQDDPTAGGDTSDSGTADTSGQDNSAGGEELSGKLTFMVAEYSPKTKPFWEKHIATFEEANPSVDVTLEVVGWQQMHDTTAQRIAAGNLPDLVNTATIWLPEWVDSGALRTVGDDLLTPELKADIVPALLDKGAEYEGESWGLPIAAAARALFYNKDLFEEAGIADAPATWDEMRDATVAIKEKTDQFGYAFDAKGVQAFRYFGFFLWNNGGDFFDSDGKAAFNSPEGAEALEFLVELSKTNAVPDPTGTALEDFQPLFQTGRLGMMIDGNFFIAALSENAPDLNYAVAPVPISRPGVQPVTWGVTDTLVISKDAPADLARAFIAHIYQKDVRTEFDVNEGLLPVLTSQSTDPVFAEPTMKAWVDMLDVARFDPLHPNYSQMQELVKNEVQAAIKGSKTAQQALDDAAAAFDALVSN